jgi:tetratricopeptide (TPR) repeat protein
MMRHSRNCLLFLVIISLALAIPAFAQMTPTGKGAPGPGQQSAPAGTIRGGALMPVDVYTPISHGYDFIRDGKYEAARNEFAKAVELDKFNPFALNNLAVLDERDGKLNDALAQLKDATLHAAEYKDKVAQTCFAGGGCMAVKPVRAVGETSSILPIIQDNIKKLEAKIAATGTPPPPGSPPPLMPAPKAK